ncbi:Glutamine-dependent NAD(+) synthetase [Vibrio aerogenes CECT 7868]|uniref:Glutamine-dependent NAD(+) synthetase n=1 Tax=Vibrio aerogenes CECT 7868 TaxID=1216006 RepID=A0A1M6A6A8_9VIBR|nr:NAD(+) synthase [Vibrio aerogenes]SHI31986.1 Glutamine-dependent NAD(+) synthetase [Vibrio aerogenes CECT 7868]
MIVSSASINQTPRDWTGNISRIQAVIDQAAKAGATLIVTPELGISGYGCEDYFYQEKLTDTALQALSRLRIPDGVLVTVGLPVLFCNRLYNAVALLQNSPDSQIIQGMAFKKQLAMNGIHYEARWFSRWESGSVVYTDQITGYPIPVGDPTFDYQGYRIGFETCEESWVPNRSARALFDRGVDIIINASASHFAIGKFATRKQMVIDGSRTFGAAYIYSNLNGCESGRAVYDGGCLIASGGDIIAQGERLHFTDSAIICAAIDAHDNRLVQQMNSQTAELNNIMTDTICLDTHPGDVAASPEASAVTSVPPVSVPPLQPWETSAGLHHEEAIRAVALGLRDWSKKTATNGFALSLSGGADSALVAVATHLSVYLELSEYKRKGRQLSTHLARFLPETSADGRLLSDIPSLTKRIMHHYMLTLYQGTGNSSETTLNAAKSVATGTGACFDSWDIDPLIKSYQALSEKTIARPLTWEQDDIPLQNIQARVRAPGIWMLANIDNKLLLTTSNMSEGAVGYVTMDGDSSGVLAPISGITKGRILNILSWLNTTGILVDETPYPLPCLQPVVDQRPTAELRPEQQNDEDDLMPFAILDRIVELFMVKRKCQQTIFETLTGEFPHYSHHQLNHYVELFFRLFKRNQWKRERQAPGFHIEVNSLDPKTYGRFSLFTG